MSDDNDFIEIPSKFWDRVIGNYNPVVMVTTRNASGESNAAPYAMCMEVCHVPPLLAVGVGKTKDTYHNLKSSGELYPPETNELVEAGLKELPGLKVNVNRIKECKLHFECEVEWIKEAGNHFIVLGKVVSVTGSKDVLTDDYRIKFDSLRPVHYVGRGTDTFLESGKLVKVKREPLEPEK
jgi:flavin reductase (DIM6/NTAB) family NADH-FMN oxidoreductase RutF